MQRNIFVTLTSSILDRWKDVGENEEEEEDEEEEEKEYELSLYTSTSQNIYVYFSTLKLTRHMQYPRTLHFTFNQLINFDFSLSHALD